MQNKYNDVSILNVQVILKPQKNTNKAKPNTKKHSGDICAHFHAKILQIHLRESLL